MRDLSKKKLEELSRALKNYQEAFRADVEALAERARTEILPYFKKHGLDFVAGNGTWFISKPTDGDAVKDEDLPANIRAVLLLEVTHADHLGFYIRNIRRGDPPGRVVVVAHVIGYLVVVLLLGVIRVAINDGSRNRRLAWILCAAWLFTMTVLLACRRCM